MKTKTENRILNEARLKAIERAHIPRNIKESYKISIESGKVVLSKRNK